MKITIISGSRADWGLLRWPIKLLSEQFDVTVEKIHGSSFSYAFEFTTSILRPDLLLILGDRFEIMACATAAHLRRIPIAHLCGGDVTKGSYDDAMRDCISRMATLHFPSSKSAAARLEALGYTNIHMIGSTGIDYILNGNWRKDRPIKDPYVVISYQPETIDGGNGIEELIKTLPTVRKVFILPNRDAGSMEITVAIQNYCLTERQASCDVIEEQDDFLNLIAYCDEFIGNSSALLYEAPTLGIKTRMVGKRQERRVAPEGDGHASERLVEALNEYARILPN